MHRHAHACTSTSRGFASCATWPAWADGQDIMYTAEDSQSDTLLLHEAHAYAHAHDNAVVSDFALGHWGSVLWLIPSGQVCTPCREGHRIATAASPGDVSTSTLSENHHKANKSLLRPNSGLSKKWCAFNDFRRHIS